MESAHMQRVPIIAVAVAVLAFLVTAASAAEGNVSRGQRLFRNCAACHALEPDKHLTGPSLSGVWNRRAGAVESFTRYSDALKSSELVWNDETLDAWLADPQHVIPGNQMTFPGMKDSQQRRDLVAFLKQATPANAQMAPESPTRGEMGGMMGGNSVPNLKTLDPEDRVRAISYCRDTYEITTADGKKRKYWERNLRLKTDSSADGPTKDAPALVAAGMMGDRADVIFAEPDEIGRFVNKAC